MALPALLADYLFIGPLVVDRLADQVPDIPVELCETSDDVLKADTRKRVLKVLWGGDLLGADAAGGSAQALRQAWLVMVALGVVPKVTNVRATAAGPVMSQVHKALAGWTPAGAQRPFKRAQARVAPRFTEKSAVYPLAFEIQLNL